MSKLTIDDIVEMSRYDLHRQNRLLILGCLLDFDRRRRKGIDVSPAAWANPDRYGYSDLDMWEASVLEETPHGNFVDANRRLIPGFRDGKKIKLTRWLARTFYRCYLASETTKPVLKTIAVPILVAVVTALVLRAIPLNF